MNSQMTMAGQASQILMEKGKEKLIVLPFQPGKGQVSDGTGLGLHFLLGNLVCLHPDLTECWFGWRVKQIFGTRESLTAFCQGRENGPGAAETERSAVRFWIRGTYVCKDAGGSLDLVLQDTKGGQAFAQGFSIAFEDRLKGLRQAVFDWLDRTGLGAGGRELGLWDERIDRPGLNLLGQALGALYMNYVTGDGAALDLAPFERAAFHSPGSYLVQDLLGWGRYKRLDLDGACQAFERAVAINPHGLGAYAGLMHVALVKKDRDRALAFALEKGRCRREAPEKAHAFVQGKLG